MNSQFPGLRQVAGMALVVVLALATAVAIWKAFAGSSPFSAKPYTISAELPHTSGVVTGAQVRMAGVTIGRVTDVSRTPAAKAKVQLVIDAEYAPLNADVRMVPRTKTLLGEGYLQVSHGSEKSGVIVDGGSIAVGNIKQSERLDDLLNTFDGPTRQSLKLVIAGASQALNGKAPAISQGVGAAGQAAGQLSEALSGLASQKDGLQQLTANSADVLAAVNSQSGALKRFVNSGSQVLSTTASRQKKLEQLVATLPGFMRQVRSSSTNLVETSSDLKTASYELRTIGKELTPTLQGLNQVSPQLVTAVKNSGTLLPAGNKALPEATDLIAAVGKASESTYPAMREVIPVADLYSAARREYVAFAANIASLMNGKLIGGGNFSQSYAPASLTLWNETLGGWKHRLASNRKNSYPEPGASLNLSKKGYLNSFDCRHANNPMPLGPLGAAPPCVEQGPWTFRGQTAYYHRLQRAAP